MDALVERMTPKIIRHVVEMVEKGDLENSLPEILEHYTRMLDEVQLLYKEDRLICKTDDGYFIADVCQDENYPGIDIEYRTENLERKYYLDEISCMPRVLFEKPMEDGAPRVLVWASSENEGYSEEVEFDGGFLDENNNE